MFVWTVSGTYHFKTVLIKVVAVGMPISMTSTVYPETGILPANNEDKFTIDYFLYDIYGNPMENRVISISTNVSGETPLSLTSDSNGLIRFYYGPKISIVTASITAIAQDNTSVTKNLIAKFGNASPTHMVLGVTPQTMASRDVSENEHAFVRATVIDNFGNPVQGELVTFSLGSPSFYPYTPSDQPFLSNTTAITDKNGNVIVQFYPGSFVNWGEDGWNSSATGSVDITATWIGISKQVTATWKNYAYLSIEANVEPPIVKVNETVDITIDVIGNGFDPVGSNAAAIIDLDSSSSIWSNPDTPGPKRIDSAKEAAKAFAMAMLLPEPTTNWIGVNSFGNEKNNDDRLLAPQNKYIPLVEGKITNLLRGTNSQGFGGSIIDSVNNLSQTQKDRTPQDKVRAVIVLKDSGGGNLEANGQAEAENDAAAVIALAKVTQPKTLIFTVYYYDGKSESSSTQLILQDIANRTGGKFFRSENSTQLKLDFIEIANILKTAAGVNASMNLNFQQQEVNSTPMEGSEVFTYVPVPDPDSIEPFYDLNSTITSRDDVKGRTRIFWPNSSHSVINQSDDWYDDYQLHFNIGTINTSERWNATYRLKVKQPGLINLFNCSSSASYISYNDGTENLCLPNLYIIATPDVTPSGSSLLELSDLIPQTGNFTDSVPMQWNLKYTGYEPTITERYHYCYNDAECVQPVEFGQSSLTSSTTLGWEISRNYTLDVTKFPPGEYRIIVIASVPGIPPDEERGSFTKQSTLPDVNIWLK